MENRKRNNLYTDKEIGKLIKRATELQKESKDSQKRGLSLKEIEDIAEDFGIDPEYLRVSSLTEADSQPSRVQQLLPAAYWADLVECELL